MDKYQVGVWYRKGSMVFILEETNRWMRDGEGDMVPMLQNKHTIQCSSDEIAENIRRLLEKQEEYASALRGPPISEDACGSIQDKLV